MNKWNSSENSQIQRLDWKWLTKPRVSNGGKEKKKKKLEKAWRTVAQDWHKNSKSGFLKDTALYNTKQGHFWRNYGVEVPFVRLNLWLTAKKLEVIVWIWIWSEWSWKISLVSTLSLFFKRILSMRSGFLKWFLLCFNDDPGKYADWLNLSERTQNLELIILII